jgi:hypothetical protein
MNWKQFLSHAGLAAAIVLLAWGVHAYIYSGAQSDIDRWLKSSLQQDARTELPKEKLFDSGVPAWGVRLQEQYNDVRGHSAMQLQAYIDVQKSYYAATLMWTLLAGCASLLGIFVIKDGWDKSNNFVLNAALTITLLMTFWQAIPKVLSMSANVAAAKKSYLSCVQLGNEVRSFAKQVHTPTKGQTEGEMEAEFINRADKRFSEIRNLNFDIDTNQGPDYRKAIQDQMKQ